MSVRLRFDRKAATPRAAQMYFPANLSPRTRVCPYHSGWSRRPPIPPIYHTWYILSYAPPSVDICSYLEGWSFRLVMLTIPRPYHPCRKSRPTTPTARLVAVLGNSSDSI